MLNAHLQTPYVALLILAVVTAIGVLEGARFPVAPFYFIHAILCLLIPFFVLPVGAMLRILPPFENAWTIAVLASALLFLEGYLFPSTFERFLKKRVRAGDLPRFSPLMATNAIVAKAKEKFGFSDSTFALIFLFYLLIWAPIAEELFYWGYCFNAMKPHFGFFPTAFTVSLFFALRHGAHFFFLRKEFPAPAAAFTVFFIFTVAMLNSTLYVLSNSLTLLIAVHFLSNVLSILFSSGNESQAPHPQNTLK